MKTNYALSIEKFTNFFSLGSKATNAQIIKVDYDSLIGGIPNDYFKSSQSKIKAHIDSDFFQDLLIKVDNTSTPSTNITKKWDSILSDYYSASLELINGGLMSKDNIETIYNIETEYNYFSPNFKDSIQEVLIVISAQLVVIANYYNYSSIELSGINVEKVDTGLRFKLFLKAI